MSANSPSDPPVRRNILIVGELGVGKSSIVNLIAGKHVVDTSDRARSCTLQSQHHNVDIGSAQLALHDTAGLHEAVGHMKVNDYLDAVYQAHSLISKLESSDGISLLVYCMKAGRISITMQQTYNLFVEVLCRYRVPVVIAVTHCEGYDCMEDWWKENEKNIQNYGFHSVGHACVTATPGYKNAHIDKYKESRETMKRLLVNYSQGRSWKEGKTNWLKRVAVHIRNWLPPRRAYRLGRSELKKKLIKRCGYSREDAESIVQKICEARGSKPEGGKRSPSEGSEVDNMAFFSDGKLVACRRSDSLTSGDVPILPFRR
ncbi:P-loop containing nucleoside triphosphate hydrolase protein [Phlebopus sp. FC_14]|nr:P-loop containing nucleoside triphosphate hydrolase protein [Phlebopus sp. FC_14]